MTFQDIMDKWKKKRDFSGSLDDEYAQLLTTLEMQSYLCGWHNDFKRILISAEKEGRRLLVKNRGGVIVDEIYPKDVIAV